MKTINNRATSVFAAILAKLEGERHIKIFNEPFMPLNIERLEEGVMTEFGKGAVISLCHYGEMNGDLMQDPEMVFIAVDNRENGLPMNALHVIPIMYQQAYMGIYQESISLTSGQISHCIPFLQSQHTQIANLWLTNIEEQGFLDKNDQS